MTNQRMSKIVEQVQHNKPEATEAQIIEIVEQGGEWNNFSYLQIAGAVLDYLDNPLTDEDDGLMMITEPSKKPERVCGNDEGLVCLCGECYSCLWRADAGWRVHRILFGE